MSSRISCPQPITCPQSTSQRQHAWALPSPVIIVFITAMVSIATITEVHRAHTESSSHARMTGSQVKIHPVDAAADAHEAGSAVRSSLTQAGFVKLSEHAAASATSPQAVVAKAAVTDALETEWTENEPMCNTEAHAEYDGEKVLQWGNLNLQDSEGDCCSSCMIDPDCNVWVYCGSKNGCNGRSHRECWLKRASSLALTASIGSSDPATCQWTSGSILSPEAAKAEHTLETARIKALMADEHTPLVYLDITMKGVPVGRIIIALYTRESPLAAENFRQLCTGEKGQVLAGHEGGGRNYTLKGALFYRIIDRFIDQSGAGTDSVYGGHFKNDPGGLLLKHNKPGLLSMANSGPDTNTSHFSIVMAPAPHLDGHYTIFGEVVEGLDVARKINELSRGKKDNMAGSEEKVVIAGCGQIRGPFTHAHADQTIVIPGQHQTATTH